MQTQFTPWRPRTTGHFPGQGNPLYRTEEFQEIEIYKVWQLAESVSMRFDLCQQWVIDETVEVYGITFHWVGGFDLFEDYFRKGGMREN